MDAYFTLTVKFSCVGIFEKIHLLEHGQRETNNNDNNNNKDFI